MHGLISAIIPSRRLLLTPFNRNKFALVDSDDFAWLNQWKWRFDGEYASRRENYKKIYLHRIINNTPKGKLTDHINRNKFDNRRSNLRTVSKNGNQRNHKKFITNTSGFNGVSWHKSVKKWESYLWKNNKKILIGYFNKIENAFSARKKGELLYW